MNKYLMLLLTAHILGFMATSQNVGIGTATPMNKLHVAGGFRLDTLIGVGGTGVLIHNSVGSVYGLKFTGNVNDILRGDGTFGAGSSGGGTPSNVWMLSGNAGTDPATNFIGTTDAQPLLFRVNNFPAGIIHPAIDNTAFGYKTLVSNTSVGNTANGYQALFSNTEGFWNTANGVSALYSNTTGSENIANGFQALYSNTTGTHNTANGFRALYANATGTSNTATGAGALFSNTTGSHNTANGLNALASNTTGSMNTANGLNALYSNTTGSNNTANGYQALYSNSFGTSNMAIGYQALYANTNGVSNTASGFQALFLNTTGQRNTAHGAEALRFNTTGSNNTTNGFASLLFNTTGSENTANGNFALWANTTGGRNTAVGNGALMNTAASNYNTAIGSDAGGNFNNGWNNVFVGANTGTDGVDYYNVIAIGQGTICTSPNQVRLGNSSTQSLFCLGAYASTSASSANVVVNSAGQIMRSTSSTRYKTNIEDLDINTENIYQLQPRSYTSINDGQKYFGLVAEEVNKVIPELVEYAKEKEVVKGSESERLIPDAVRYPMLSVLLLKEMQKHEKRREEQQATIEKQQKQIDELIKELQAIKEKMK